MGGGWGGKLDERVESASLAACPCQAAAATEGEEVREASVEVNMALAAEAPASKDNGVKNFVW